MAEPSSASKASKRAHLWKPGQSGNPRGRPSEAADIARLARDHGPRAIRILAECLNDPRLRLPAAIALLDRGYGKPVQALTASEDAASITFLHLVAMRAINGQAAATTRVFDAEHTEVTNGTNGNGEPPDLMAPATE